VGLTFPSLWEISSGTATSSTDLTTVWSRKGRCAASTLMQKRVSVNSRKKGKKRRTKLLTFFSFLFTGEETSTTSSICERHCVIIEGVELFCVGVLQPVSAKNTGKRKIAKRERRTLNLFYRVASLLEYAQASIKSPGAGARQKRDYGELTTTLSIGTRRSAKWRGWQKRADSTVQIRRGPAAYERFEAVWGGSRKSYFLTFIRICMAIDFSR